MCGRGIEDDKHFLLHYHRFDLMRSYLFRQITIPGSDITNWIQMHCAVCLVENRIIIEATISFINAAKRFA